MEITEFLIPAIDIKGGRVVRLTKGDFEKVKVYSDDPIKLASRFQEVGFRRLHVVDLDGAEGGKLKNYDLVRGIREVFEGEIEVGGGVRSYEVAKALLEEGIDYVVIGTLALKDPEEFERIVRDFPNRVILSVDSKGGKVAIGGWRERTELTPANLAKRYEEKPIWGYLYTIVERDGSLEGVDPEPYRRIRSFVKKPILASGGVSSLEDVEKLYGIVEGVVVGKAIYEGKIQVI